MSKNVIVKILIGALLAVGGGAAGVVVKEKVWDSSQSRTPATQARSDQQPGPGPNPSAVPDEVTLAHGLQEDCTKDKLRGAWLEKAEVTDGQLVLQGAADSPGQISAVKLRAEERFKELPDLAKRCPNGVNAALKVLPIRERLASLQKRWAEGYVEPNPRPDPGEQRVRRALGQTRLDLDDVSYAAPNALRISAVNISPAELAAADAVKKMIADALRPELKTQPTQAGAVPEDFSNRLVIEVQLKSVANPRADIEKAAREQNKIPGLALDDAWFDGGQLRFRGVLSREADRAAFHEVAQGVLAQPEFAALAGPGGGWSAEGLQVLDVTSLPKALQQAFASGDSSLRKKTRLDGDALVDHPLSGLQLEFTGVCLGSPADLVGRDPQGTLSAALTKELAEAVKKALPSAPPFTVALAPGFVFRPALASDLQEAVNRDRQHFRAVVIDSIRFDEMGRLEVFPRSEPPEKHQRVVELAAKLLGAPAPPAPGSSEEEEEPEKPSAEPSDELEGYEKVLADFWKDMGTARPGKPAKWPDIHLDNITAVARPPEQGGNTFKITGVWLYDGEKPAKDRKDEFKKYFTEQAKTLLKPYFSKERQAEIEKIEPELEEVESPLVKLREAAIEGALEGVFFLDASFLWDGSKNSTLHLSGYYGGKDDKEQLRKVEAKLLDPQVVNPVAFGKRLEKPLKPDLKDFTPIDYTALRTAIQKKFAAAKDTPQALTRVNEVVFRYVKGKKAPVLFGKGVCLLPKGDDAVRTALRDALKTAAESSQNKTISEVEFDVSFLGTPVAALQQEVAAEPRLDGVLIEGAQFNDDGKMVVRVLRSSRETDTDVTQLLSRVKWGGGMVEAVPKFLDAAWLPQGTKWSALAREVQAKLAAETGDLPNLPRQTRVDRIYFAYDGPDSALVLHVEGVCINKTVNEDKARTDLQKLLTSYLKTNRLTLLQAVARDEAKQTVDVSQIKVKKFPADRLQSALNKDKIKALINDAYYDENGTLKLDPGIAFSDKADVGKKKLKAILETELKSTGIYAPETEVPAAPEPDKKPQEEEEEEAAPPRVRGGVSVEDLVVIDWNALLDELRRQFASDRSEPLFRQTRIDDAEFRYDAGDPTPHLHFQMHTLAPKGDREQQRKQLEKKLSDFFRERLVAQLPRLQFKVILPDDAQLFFIDPTPALQRYVATNHPALDGVLFVAAWYDPQRRLNFDVILDKAAGQEERIKKELFQEGTPARKLLLLAMQPGATPAQEPLLNPKTDVKWEQERQALQGNFSRSHEPLLERTRVDRLYFTYEGNDTSDRQLRVEGVCLQPGSESSNQDTVAEAVKERWQPRFPGVDFRVIARGGVRVLKSPIIELQELAHRGQLDNVLFESAVYDEGGKLHLRTYLANLGQEAQIKELSQRPEWEAALKPALRLLQGKLEAAILDAPRLFPWRGAGVEGTGLVERLQGRFAASDVRAAQQTRLDRAYFLYDAWENRQLHFEGVSLWDGLPKPALPEFLNYLTPPLTALGLMEALLKADLPLALSPVCRQVLPEPRYLVVAGRVTRKPNPAPPLQQQVASANDPKFDGLLFQDVGFDATGRLRFDVLVSSSKPDWTEDQRIEARSLIKKSPVVVQILEEDPHKRPLNPPDFRPFDWEAMLRSVRAWAAGTTTPRDRDARRTRIDRAFFTRDEDGGCQLQLVGATLLFAPLDDFAAEQTVYSKIVEAFRAPFLDQLRPLKLKLPPDDPQVRARRVKVARRDLLTVLRQVIPTRRVLDGVNLSDVVIDEAGLVTLEGHWIGNPAQVRDLGEALEEALETEPQLRLFTRAGFVYISRSGSPLVTEPPRFHLQVPGLKRLSVVRTDLLLRDLRRWLVDKTEVEEVLFDRLYFDAAAKLRIDGFFTRPEDQKPAEKAGLDGLLAYPVGRALLGLDPEGIVKPDLEGKDVIHLVKRASLVTYLRGEVPADPTLDGVRIDRCYYDADAAFVLNGLEDDREQSRRLKGIMDWAQESPTFKGHLADGWHRGQFTPVPMRRMLICLRRQMPDNALFDGMRLERGYHDAANHLVITGAAIGTRRRDKAEKELAEMIAADPDWRIRVSYGGADLKIKLTTADLELGQRAFERAVELYAHDRRAADAVADLDTALFHDPTDATAWYFRAVCYLAIKDEAAAKRDLRRVLGFAQGRPPLVDQVIDYGRLELVQGRYRADASQMAEKFSLTLPVEKPLAALLKELCEEPPKPRPVPDEAPGWSAAPCSPACTRMGAPCWLPR
jgi:hypothetical protein